MIYILIFLLIILIRKYLRIFNANNQIGISFNQVGLNYDIVKFIPYYYFWFFSLMMKPKIIIAFIKDIQILIKHKDIISTIKLVWYFIFQYSILYQLFTYIYSTNGNTYTDSITKENHKITETLIDNIDNFYKFYVVCYKHYLNELLNELFYNYPIKYQTLIAKYEGYNLED